MSDDRLAMTRRQCCNTTAAAKALARGPGRPIAAPRPAFLARLDGLIVGPDPANGIFVKNVFQHPGLALALDVPAGWKTKNTPAAAIASEPDGRAAVALQLAADGNDPLAGAREDGLDEKEASQVTRTTISGLPAAQVRMHLTWIAYQGHVCRVAGISARRAFETYREAFARTAASFRPLRRDERERMAKLRLRPRPARAGESVAAFVARTGGTWKPDQTAVANGIAASATLDDGFAAGPEVRARRLDLSLIATLSRFGGS